MLVQDRFHADECQSSCVRAFAISQASGFGRPVALSHAFFFDDDDDDDLKCSWMSFRMMDD